MNIDFMSLLYSIPAFIVAIGVLVTVHEFGHFWVARLCDVKVLRFSVGFGKPLWMKRFGPDQTEFVVAAIPFGGYVKMLDEREGEVASQDLDRAFNRKSVWRRFAIVSAGPAFNFLFAILAYYLIFMAGVSGLKPVIGVVTDPGRGLYSWCSARRYYCVGQWCRNRDLGEGPICHAGRIGWC